MKSTVLLFSLAILLASCGDENEPDPSSTTAAFSSPESSELTSVVSYRLTATVSFQNQSQNATRYVWNFGDGSTTEDENPTHTYTAAGAYSVKLKVFGPEKTDSLTKTITIVPYNLFAHSTLPFTGTYLCKVVRVFTCSPCGTTPSRARLPDRYVYVTKDGAEMNVVDDQKNSWPKLSYWPTNSGSPQLPDGTKHTFSVPPGPTSGVGAYASFYTSGDSATFHPTSTFISASGGVYSYYYYGIRRP